MGTANVLAHLRRRLYWYNPPRAALNGIGFLPAWVFMSIKVMQVHQVGDVAKVISFGTKLYFVFSLRRLFSLLISLPNTAVRISIPIWPVVESLHHRLSRSTLIVISVAQVYVRLADFHLLPPGCIQTPCNCVDTLAMLFEIVAAYFNVHRGSVWGPPSSIQCPRWHREYPGLLSVSQSIKGFVCFRGVFKFHKTLPEQ